MEGTEQRDGKRRQKRRMVIACVLHDDERQCVSQNGLSGRENVHKEKHRISLSEQHTANV